MIGNLLIVGVSLVAILGVFLGAALLALVICTIAGVCVDCLAPLHPGRACR